MTFEGAKIGVVVVNIEIMIRRYEWLRVGYKQKFTIVSHRDKNLILSN